MFKCYNQLEHSDCGLTCIRMVARHYGKSIPMQYLKSITDLNRLGMSIKDIVDCCNKIKLDSVAVKITLEQLNIASLPIIVFWQQRHFVVVYKIKNGKYYVADPSQGKIVYNEYEFRDYWLPDGSAHGLAILVEPKENFHSMEWISSHGYKRFISYALSYLKDYKGFHLISIAITILIGCADFAIPLLMKNSVDNGIGNQDIHLIIILLLAQLSIMFGGLVGSGFIQLLFTRIGMNMYSKMVKSFLDKLSRLPISFFDRKVSSDLIQKISDHSRIKDFVLSFPIDTLMALFTFCVFSVLLFTYTKFIFVIFILLSLLEIGWNLCFINRRKAIDYGYFIHSSENANHAYELAHGMADLKVNNAERIRINKWKESQDRVNDLKIKATRLDFIQDGGRNILSRIKELTVTGIGSILVIGGDLTLGGLMTLGYITGRLAQPFTSISKNIISFQNALLSHQRVNDIINNSDHDRGSENFRNSSIEFINVWFKYPGSGSPYVIKDFSLSVEPGETIALVGESGCGKSTLIKLMLGFYIPQKGKVNLSGVPIDELDNSDWLKHCGVVLQEPRIFTGSVLDNVCMTEIYPDIERVKDSIDKAGLSEFISTLPLGIYTRIGATGIELSGGQKQRLMIARAIYKKPDILFLDEATSSLDANNERNIIQNLLTQNSDKTIIIAAHRLSTVQHADRILFIKNGEVIEEGCHSELISQKGAYWRLVKNQIQLSI